MRIFEIHIVLGIFFLQSISVIADTCFSERLGYPCCKDNKVLYTNDIGNWGIENGNWCGIKDTDECQGRDGYPPCQETKIADTCFSERLGYPCCKGNEVLYTDNDGKWGVENDEWCGIKDTDECQGRDGYPPCQETTEALYTDDSEWGVENDGWCVICKKESFPYFYTKILSKLGGKKNFAYSPESLNIALKLYEEFLVDGEEKKEILNLIGNKNYLDYKNSLSSKIVNRIWIDSKKKYDFSSVVKMEKYLYAIDMSADNAKEIKDAYVSEVTDGFITSTPTEFSSKTIYDFMNILYFKGKWNKDANNFRIKNIFFPFKTIDGKESHATSIGFTKKNGYYLKNDDAIAVNLYYEKEEIENYAGFQMIVILPNEDKSISDIDIRPFLPYDYEDEVTPAKLKNNFDELYFEMPKFSVETEWFIKSGTKEASLFELDHFSGGSLNRNIYNASISAEISQVVRIECDEKGTTAAAVTEVHGSAKALPKTPIIFNFICNRPFIYVLYDNVNDDIGFVGQVMTV
jgi:serine protease inhibitor